MQPQSTPVQTLTRTQFSPSDWMRIFACRLARQRPELSADAVVEVAVSEFRSLYLLQPEEAAARCAY